ncbi:MAG: hypothetical protein ACI9YH_003549, partial [Colwellia sp.]
MLSLKYSLLLLFIFCSFDGVGNEEHSESRNKSAPIASAAETAIKHWRQPEINREFWDIPLLQQAFVDIKPASSSDGIAVGELGIDGGKKANILKLAEELAEGKHGKFDSLLILHKGKL